MKKRFVYIIFFLNFLMLQSCAAYWNRPIIEDNAGNNSRDHKGISTLAMTAERKAIILNIKNNRFCSEGPQDFGQTINAVNKLVASINKGELKKPGAKLELEEHLITSLKEVSKQPFGIQFLRYQSSALCQYFANEALTKGELRVLVDRTLSRTYKLLKKELAINQGISLQDVGVDGDSSVVFAKPRFISGKTNYVLIDDSLTTAYFELDVGFRESGTDNKYAYVKPPQVARVSKKNLSLKEEDNGFYKGIPIHNMPKKSVNDQLSDFESGDVMEGRLKRILKKGSDPKRLSFANTAVFYNDGDQHLFLLPKPKKENEEAGVCWDNYDPSEGKDLGITLPVNVEQAFLGYDKANKIIIEAGGVPSEKDRSYFFKDTRIESKQVNVKVKKRYLRRNRTNKNAFGKIHNREDINLKFKMINPQSDDVPEIKGILTIKMGNEKCKN